MTDSSRDNVDMEPASVDASVDTSAAVAANNDAMQTEDTTTTQGDEERNAKSLLPTGSAVVEIQQEPGQSRSPADGEDDPDDVQMVPSSPAPAVRLSSIASPPRSGEADQSSEPLAGEEPADDDDEIARDKEPADEPVLADAVAVGTSPRSTGSTDSTDSSSGDNGIAADGRSTTCLFVGNLSTKLTGQQLFNRFKPFGATIKNVRILFDHIRRTSKGVGFVEFDRADEAAAACRALDRVVCDGRPMEVKHAKPPKSTSASQSADESRGRQRRSKQQEEMKGRLLDNCLYVRNLEFDVTVKELKTAFERHGQVVDVRLLHDSRGQSRGIAFIDFLQPDDAARAKAQLDRDRSFRPAGREVETAFAVTSRGRQLVGATSAPSQGQRHGASPSGRQGDDDRRALRHRRDDGWDPHNVRLDKRDEPRKDRRDDSPGRRHQDRARSFQQPAATTHHPRDRSPRPRDRDRDRDRHRHGQERGGPRDRSSLGDNKSAVPRRRPLLPNRLKGADRLVDIGPLLLSPSTLPSPRPPRSPISRFRRSRSRSPLRAQQRPRSRSPLRAQQRPRSRSRSPRRPRRPAPSPVRSVPIVDRPRLSRLRARSPVVPGRSLFASNLDRDWELGLKSHVSRPGTSG